MISKYFSDPDTIPRRILLTLLAVVTIAIGAVVTLAVWMKVETNEMAQANTFQMVENAVQAQRSTLQALTRDYAQWEEFFDWVGDGNEDAIESNVGSGVTESATFDLISVVNKQGLTLYHYAFDVDVSSTRAAYEDLGIRTAALLDGVPAGETDTFTWFENVNGSLMLLSVEYVVPDEISDPTADFPILLTGLLFDQSALTELGDQLLIDNIASRATSGAEGSPEISLKDSQGQVAAHLSWSAPYPGDVLMNRAIPVIIALSIILFSGALMVGKGSSRQTKAFLKERSVARTDHLTGVINRGGLDSIVADGDVADAIGRGRAALIYLDLNEFKQLNDTAGHQAGDLALRITADKLTQSVRQTDFVARLGGDEFVCLIIDKHPREVAQTVVARIIQRTRKAIDFGHDNIAIKPSIGVAVAEKGATWVELLQQADTAMYCAKDKKQERAVYYDDHILDDDIADVVRLVS